MDRVAKRLVLCRPMPLLEVEEALMALSLLQRLGSGHLHAILFSAANIVSLQILSLLIFSL